VVVSAARPQPVEAPWLYNDDPPEIVRVWLSTEQFRAGDVARVRVTTTTNAASVEARIESYGRALRKESPGQFTGLFHVPTLPPFLRRGYTLRFIARNSLGTTTQQSVGIELL